MAEGSVRPPLRASRAAWVFLTGAAVVGLVGIVAHAAAAALLASAVAPTAYVLVVDPQTNRTKISHVLAAHATALIAGPSAGRSWSSPSGSGSPSRPHGYCGWSAARYCPIRSPAVIDWIGARRRVVGGLL